MVVVAAGRNEKRAGIAAHGDVEAEGARVEGLGRGEVADIQVDVAHSSPGRHRGGRVLLPEVAEQAVEIEWQGGHL